MPKRNRQKISVQRKKNRRGKCGMSPVKRMTILPAFTAMNFTRTPRVVRDGSNASNVVVGPMKASLGPKRKMTILLESCVNRPYITAKN